MGFTGIVPATIQRLIDWAVDWLADGVWGDFGCGTASSITGAGDGELGPNEVARRKPIEAIRRR
jgi:hypothetical protein